MCKINLFSIIYINIFGEVVKCSILQSVSLKKKPNTGTTESVKLKTEIVNLVREDKKKTRVPIGAFFELAAMEKLNKNNNGQ